MLASANCDRCKSVIRTRWTTVLQLKGEGTEMIMTLCSMCWGAVTDERSSQALHRWLREYGHSSEPKLM